MKQEIYKKELREWDLNSKFHQNNIRHPFRVWFWKQVLSLFDIELAGKSILEVGCGSGLLTTLLKNRKNKVYGIDFSKGMIDVAKANNPSVEYKVAPAEKLPFRDKSFDIVVAAMLFHHLEVQGLLNPSVYEIKRVLKRGGEFCILDHSGNILSAATLSLFNLIKKIFITFKGQFASSGSSYEIPFSGYNLVNCLKQDFEVISIKPISTVFFQFFSAFSHGIEYLFGEKKAISFEKIILPLLIFLEDKFSFNWLCTELSIKLVKK